MKVIITPTYFLFVFIAIFGLIGSIFLNVPVWVMAVIGVALAYFLLHEWMHVYAAKNVGIPIDTVILDIGDNRTFVTEDKNNPDDNRKIAHVFLAGAIFDMVFWGALIFLLIVDGIIQHDILELLFATFLFLANIWSSTIEWSDFQQYHKLIGA